MTPTTYKLAVQQWTAAAASTADWYQPITFALTDNGTSNYKLDNYTIATNATLAWEMQIDSIAARQIGSYNTPKHSYQRQAQPQQAPAARQPAPRPFNRYVNASDLLEEFIAFCGAQGVRQGEMMTLPVELFVRWLVIRACEADQEEPGITLELPAPTPQPRCLGCQRWMRRDVVLPFHGGRCADRYYRRLEAA